MKRMVKSVIVCGLLLVLSLVFQGCQSIHSEGMKTCGSVTPLGGSNGYILLLYPNGAFYVVDLAQNNAHEIGALPRVVPTK